MALAPRINRRRSEPLIALINIIFLMLIFFLVSATLAPPMDGEVELVDTQSLDGRAPPDAAVIYPDGTLHYQGRMISPEAYLALRSEAADGEAPRLRLVPDRAVPAADLIAIAARLRAGGAAEIWIVTEQALP